MEFLQSKEVIENLGLIFEGFVIALIAAFLASPWVGRIADFLKAIDIPLNLRARNINSNASRINEGHKLRLGGLAIAISLVLTITIFNNTLNVATGIFMGILILTLAGFLDDRFEIPGSIQLVFQLCASLAVVLSGTFIPEQISILGFMIDLNTFTSQINILGKDFTYIFPAHVLTVFWIVGIINIINWVGGVDGLNISVTSVIAFTMLLFALSVSNIPLALLIAIFIGSNIGLLPYNYYPSKIIPGTIGDFLNGFMLAVFALLGGTRWTTTLIILALPIVDALIVIFLRVKSNKEVLRNPLKILSISDQNHLHHRLLAVGYSRKVVMLIETAIITIICTIAIIFGINVEGDRSDKLIIAFAISMTFIISILTVIFVLKSRTERKKAQTQSFFDNQPQKQAVVKVYVENEDSTSSEKKEDYERYVY